MKKLFVLSVIVLLLLGAWYFDIQSLVNFAEFQAAIKANPLQVGLVLFLVYVSVTALNLPFASVLTLFCGAVLGLFWGTLLVSFASSIGASLSMLLSRYLFRESVGRRFDSVLKKVNQGVEKEGKSFLFALRLTPLFPFLAVNMCFGLTKMPVRTFYWVSQLGMLPATIVYVNAGTQLADINELSVSGVLTVPLIVSFILLALLPFAAKYIVGWVKRQKVYRGFKKPGSFDTNVVVIGAGAAGLVSSYIAAAVKAKVTLVEKHQMGGDCLNTGCVPSKALIRAAAQAHEAKRAAKYGVNVEGVSIDFAQVMQHVHSSIKTVEPHDSVERYTSLGVDCVQGDADIISPWEVRIDERIITTRSIIIASGARPFIPEIKGIDNVDYLSSDNVWALTSLPKQLLVVGSGPIACELAQAFARLGSQVTIVTRSTRIMAQEDQDVSDFMTSKFEAEQITVHYNAQITEFIDPHSARLSNAQTTLEFDRVLFATGRVARVEHFGLEKLGIQTNGQGRLDVDEKLRTRFPNIYACGDVIGPHLFTHVAAHQAWFAAVNALFGQFKLFSVDYRVIPRATFTAPEVARVGLSETEAKASAVDYEVTRYDLSDLDRAITEAENEGFVKVLTSPGKDKILGATIVGHHSAELITEFVSAMKFKRGLNSILSTVHLYPSWSEANKYAAGEWKKSHVSERTLSLLRWYHRKRRH